MNSQDYERAMRLTKEDGACLVWTGAFSKTTPMWKHTSARREIYEHRTGVALAADMVVVSALNGRLCNCPCVRHLEAWSRSDLHRYATRRAPKESRYLSYARGRLANSKLDFEKAREIRMDPRRHIPLGSHLVAHDYGVSSSTIEKVWRNERWREHAPGRSVFDFAMASTRRTRVTQATRPDAALQAHGARQGQPRQGPDGS